tara:strand:+ start:384 stop:617 length:234 start_codon:yes stop_codon:yes gene_type:complete
MEVVTAKSILEQMILAKKPIFGPKFESTFSEYKSDKYKTVIKSLEKLSDRELVILLRTDFTLAAHFAGVIIATKFKK